MESLGTNILPDGCLHRLISPGCSCFTQHCSKRGEFTITLNSECLLHRASFLFCVQNRISMFLLPTSILALFLNYLYPAAPRFCISFTSHKYSAKNIDTPAVLEVLQLAAAAQNYKSKRYISMLYQTFRKSNSAHSGDECFISFL